MTTPASAHLDGDHLVVGRTRVPRAEVQRVENVRRPPRLASRLSAMALGAGGIPLAMAINAMRVEDLSWLVALPAALLLGGGFSLMTVADRYAVVLTTRAGKVDAFVDADRQRVDALTTATIALLAPPAVEN